MIEQITAVVLGTLIGLFSGLIPGMHINTLIVFILGFSHATQIDFFSISLFILAAAISQSFSGFVPSIFLGAPDDDTALAIAPGHSLLIEGKGYEALLFSVYGGLFGIVFLLVLSPLLFRALPGIYENIRPHIGILLSTIAIYMIWLEKNRFKGGLIFAMSGLLGILALNSKTNQTFAIFPLLAGLFGLSAAILSLLSVQKIPKQSFDVEVSKAHIAKNSFLGVIGGLLAGMLPGIGGAQSAIIVQKLARVNSRTGFLAIMGSINSVDVLLSVIAIYLIGNPRSGAAVAINQLLQQITAMHVVIFLIVGIVTAIIAAPATLFIGKKFNLIIETLDYKKINLLVILLLLFTSYLFAGFFGLLVCLVGSCIGLLSHFWKTKKSLLISCLMLNTILFFTGNLQFVLQYLF